MSRKKILNATEYQVAEQFGLSVPEFIEVLMFLDEIANSKNGYLDEIDVHSELKNTFGEESFKDKNSSTEELRLCLRDAQYAIVRLSNEWKISHRVIDGGYHRGCLLDHRIKILNDRAKEITRTLQLRCAKFFIIREKF